MNLNAVLKRRGFVNGRDYRIENAGAGDVLRWLAVAPMPSQAELDASWAEIRGKAYRLGRKGAYIARLGEDGTFENTVGDVLDAVIRQVELNRVAAGAASDPEFAAKLATITDIKREFPKPEQGE